MAVGVRACSSGVHGGDPDGTLVGVPLLSVLPLYESWLKTALHCPVIYRA